MLEMDPTTMATYRVHIEVDEDGRFVAECLDLAGAVADGATRDEAIQNVREVIALWLEHDAGTEVDPESFRVDDAA
jgi:predicted RNase H-like HicB family nuclease